MQTACESIYSKEAAQTVPSIHLLFSCKHAEDRNTNTASRNNREQTLLFSAPGKSMVSSYYSDSVAAAMTTN